MSRELDTRMEFSKEDLSALVSHVNDFLGRPQEEALMTVTNGILSILIEYPKARDNFSEVICNSFATTISNDLMEFVTMAQRKAFDRAIQKGTRLLEGGYDEWKKLDEEGSVRSRPQCLDHLTHKY